MISFFKVWFISKFVKYSMGVKKESTANETLNESSVNGSAASYEELVKLVTPIAKPLATRKLTKKIYKCIKKAKGDKKNLQYGIKQVNVYVCSRVV